MNTLKIAICFTISAVIIESFEIEYSTIKSKRRGSFKKKSIDKREEKIFLEENEYEIVFTESASQNESTTPRTFSFRHSDLYGSTASIFKESIKDYQFMVYIRTYLGYKWLNCAGTIITKMHILTAAKCLYDNRRIAWVTPEQINVIVGTTYPFKRAGDIHLVYAIYTNKDYVDGDKINLAVLELRRTLNFTDCLAPLKLVGPRFSSLIHEMIHNKTRLMVVGWGSEKNEGMLKIKGKDDLLFKMSIKSLRLLVHFTNLQSFQNCSRDIGYFNPTLMMCSLRGYLQDINWCPGTRGGPVLFDRLQIGVVTAGTCHFVNRREFVFSRVDTLRGFIDHTLYISGRYTADSTGRVAYCLTLIQALILIATFFSL